MIRVVFAALVFWLTLAGCSVKYAYNNLDRFVLWGVNDYVHLSAAQKSYFHSAFDDFHLWHRHSQLPLYADLLTSVPPLILDGTTMEELIAFEERTFLLGEATFDRILPISAEIITMMDEQQLADLPRLMERSNTKIIGNEGSGDITKIQDAWASELVSYARRFIGRLTRAQKSYVKNSSQKYIPERILWVEYRRRWQADFMELLLENPYGKHFLDRFTHMVKNREEYYGAELTYVFDHNEALTRGITVWLINNLTEPQQIYLSERLLGLAEDLEELARDQRW
tara:strand:- start:256 stop:1104 length:849 start_codon:yes stop_codon:yes gene_type:complete